VNNAGIEHSTPLLELELSEWDKIVGIDLRGAFVCLQAVARSLRDGGRGGSIVNVSSIHEDVPFPGFTSYCVSKGGLRMLMRNAAVELAQYKIRVNNIAPGAIATPINADVLADPRSRAAVEEEIPLGRWGTVEDVAAAVAWAASEQAGYVVGSTLFVDGGMTLYPKFI
jgi:glucose 1-dehydrogenase